MLSVIVLGVWSSGAAALAADTKQDGARYLAQSGSALKEVDASATSAPAGRWEYRLYPPFTPALGPNYWGIVEEPSFASARSELARIRRQQAEWWGWLGRVGRPEPVPFTAFNALGPIVLLDGSAWANSWSKLGPGAGREVAARERRLAAAQPLENALYHLFDDRTWSALFEEDLFRNQGMNIYQAPWLALAMTHLRVLEAELRSTTPLSIGTANTHIAAFRTIASHMAGAATDLAKRKAAPGLLTTIATDDEAVNILNTRFSAYNVRAGEGGAGSASGTMTFKFTTSGFALAEAPTGWYGGIEPVSFATIDPLTVRYDPLFGGVDRGGIVFLPNKNVRSGYRGPAGLLLPLGTQPSEAETIAEAVRRLVREANGLPLLNVEKPGTPDAEMDPATRGLVEQLTQIGGYLAKLGNMPFLNSELDPPGTPGALSAAVGARNRLWRDSELAGVLRSQSGPGATFGISAIATQLAVPMSMTPIDPPTWRITDYHSRGGEAIADVRMTCCAKVIKTRRIVTVTRSVEEVWANPAGTPRLLRMRLLSAEVSPAPAPSTATTLARHFFNLGSHYLDRNRLSGAERELRRAVSMRPDWATAWNWLAVAVVRQGRVADAAPYCEQSVLLNPKYVLALTNLADIRRVQGRIADSLQLAQRASGLAPSDAWPHIVLGHAYFANGDFGKAEVEYRAGLKIEPGNGTTHADLAGALLREDKKTEATQEASQAISLGERNHWVYKELALPKT